jgi:hypothetical protein
VISIVLRRILAPLPTVYKRDSRRSRVP